MSDKLQNPDECDHDNLTYKGADTDGAPAAVYQDWLCLDCDSVLSTVYEPAGYRIVQPPNGDAYEEEVEA